MAYPTVSAPYGFKPVDLIGGQVFSGSTRNLPIQYGYATNIFYGDFVVLVRGTIQRAAVTTASSGNLITGVFLGCSFTDPVTKQKRFSQFWPASTLAGDAVAVVCDDPDTCFRAAMVTTQGGTVIGSAAVRMIGCNVSASDLAGNINSGDSSNGVLAPVATPVTTSLPIRIVSLLPDTAFSYAATGSSTTTAITLTGAGLPAAIPAGTDVAYLAANGQVIGTGSFVATAAVAGATSVTLDATIAVPGSVVAIPAASTILFTIYPEVIVKVQFGAHSYYTATGA